jgi:AraC-like DNA-binding protein
MLAARFNYSVYYFTRLFRQHTGMSPYQYIISLRLHKAAALLMNTDMRVEEISRQLNFSSVSRFASYFQRRYGMTPLKYRKQMQRMKEKNDAVSSVASPATV